MPVILVIILSVLLISFTIGVLYTGGIFIFCRIEEHPILYPVIGVIVVYILGWIWVSFLAHVLYQPEFLEVYVKIHEVVYNELSKPY